MSIQNVIQNNFIHIMSESDSFGKFTSTLDHNVKSPLD